MKPLVLLSVFTVCLLSCSKTEPKPTNSEEDKSTDLIPAPTEPPTETTEEAKPTDDEVTAEFEALVKQTRTDFDKILLVAQEFQGDCSKAATSIGSLNIDGSAVEKQGLALKAVLGSRLHLRERIQEIAESAFPPEFQKAAGETVSAMETKCASDAQFQAALAKSGMKGTP